LTLDPLTAPVVNAQANRHAERAVRMSLYTFVKDGIRLDYHTVAMLTYHAKMFDEIVVVEGYSTDGTYEAICDISPKIRIIRRRLGRPKDVSWTANAKDAARRECTGDWCVLLDSDEFLPEWEFDRLCNVAATTSEDMFPVRPLHFYGNYRVHVLPKYALFGYRIHRNLPDIEVWGDGMNVRRREVELEKFDPDKAFEIHHFGEVRHPARLREKWRAQARRHKRNGKIDWIPSFLFDIFPHRWYTSELGALAKIYDGPFISAVQENPAEFVRDGFKVYNWARNLSHVQPATNITQPAR
jgi:glycosyltransferase involved in cell wall biosynthesis